MASSYHAFIALSLIILCPQLTLNAQPQQITSQKSIGVEVTRDGAAAGLVTVTVEANNTTA